MRSHRYSSVMYNYLAVQYEGTEECQCICPWCDGKLNFNDVKGMWYCFKCSKGGTARKLVQMLNGTYREPEADIIQLAEELRELSADVYEAPNFLPPTYLLRYKRRNGLPHQGWLDRGFDKRTCDRWELGFDPLGDKGGALTLPYWNPFTGSLDGIIFRYLNPGDGMRYQFPSGFPRSSSLYGSWLIDQMGEEQALCLVEGPTDAIRVDQSGNPAVAQYGSSLTPGQVRLLHRLGVERIILFYDYDRAGLRATVKAEHLAEEFEVEKVLWSRKKYCWHSKVCCCSSKEEEQREHTTDPARCRRMRKCECGRIHEPDPGSLDVKEILRMLERTVAV